MKEFDLIDRFFAGRGHQRKDVAIGIGDDCAVLSVPEGQQVAITTDTLIEGVHFLPNSPSRSVAYKAVAVNLSDLAAMGAVPAWVSLSLTLPHLDEIWMEGFADGFYELLEYYSVQLIGGDTVSGPMSLTITAQGFIPKQNEITRSGAKPGDWIYVTGTLGDAGAGLKVLQSKEEYPNSNQQVLINRYLYPTPRVMAGTSLRRIANACIDISDGTLADLQHIVNASGTGAVIHIDRLPLSNALQQEVSKDEALNFALSAGDDYELLFTVSEEQKGQLETILANSNIDATCIGQATGQSGVIDLRYENQSYEKPTALGYEHFSG